MRLLVCGSRTWESYDRVATEIEALAPSLVMHGGAKGADECAAYWYCSPTGIRVEALVFHADWNAHGKAAGPRRNARMLRDGKPDKGLAFGALWRDVGGRGVASGRGPSWRPTGTGDMVRRMLDARLPGRWIAAPDAPAVDLVEMPEVPR